MPRRPSRHVDDSAALGRRLREARRAAGLTQRELSFEGCTAAYVSRIEAGARVPSLQILNEFAKRLGVTAEFLATGQAESSIASELLEAEVGSRLGDEQQARRLYETILNEAASDTVRARSQLGLGRLAVARGETGEGIALLEEALESGALPPGDASAAADALARSYAGQARFDEAFSLVGRFLENARGRGDQFDEIRFAVLLANTYLDHDDSRAAHAALVEVLDSARRTVDPMSRARLYWAQSRIYSSQRQMDDAAEYAQMTLGTLRVTEQTLVAARALLLLARIENDRGNHEKALELVDEGELAATAAGEAATGAMFTVERARALAARGRQEEAAALLLAVLPRVSAAEPGHAAHAYMAAADVFRSQGDPTRALELYELADAISPISNRDTAAVLTAMAEIYEDQGDTRKALEVLKRGLTLRTGVTK